MTKKDLFLLKKIYENQLSLSSAIKELKISSPNDLNNIHIMMRRGMIQTVADIFELTVPMSEDVLSQIPLKKPIIKEFRNTASHAYGTITNILAYACIVHCADKKIIKAVKELMNTEIM